MKKTIIIGISIVVVVVAVVMLKNNGKERVTDSYQCSDTIDNDKDGLIDIQDPECHSDGDVDNFSSYDAKDDSESNKLDGSSEGTLRDLFSGEMGNDLKCESFYDVADNTMKVTMYISLEHGMRMDYELENPEQGMAGQMQTDLHMVSDKEYGYVWGDSTLGGLMQGFKIKMDDMDSEQEDIAGTEMIDFNMPLTHCEKWTVDEKIFEIPSEIEFTDPDSIEDMTIKDMDLPEGMDVNCSICNQLPGSEAADCLTSLGCN